ncbi:hypothetical protein [Bradyrhizobium sp. SZCCHNS3002]|uniref:hypothetical protein n=1 Tax=Bradyrhizobium sp. SZCCHNS3002 TaxID=3057310 RepID=UPI0028F026A7|nr:hypothetical protein [Bradyrhizobium sp. SZCCHNS3002]
MTLDGFLTFLTLIIAAYAILSSVDRLRLRLRMVAPLVISAIGFCLVVYFEFFSLLALPCPEAIGRACRYLTISSESRINAGQAAFVVVICWLALAWLALSRIRLSARALPALSNLASELAYEGRYAELTKLLEPHIELLDRAATRKLALPALRERVLELDPENLPMHKHVERLAAGIPEFSKRPIWYRATALTAARLAKLMPAGRRAEDAANEVFRLLLQTHELISFIALSRPNFGIRLLSCSVHGVQEFCDEYLRVMISNSRSILYAEIKQNQNISSKEGYWFPEQNRLLHFLFGDAKTAERLGVWKPIGDYLISALRPGNDPAYVQFLNDAADGFEDEKWADRTFVTIRFFDLMVTAAQYQGIRWHMWLYYFPHFIEELLRIYDASGENIDLTDEWPTRAAYLIYQLFSALTRWIENIKDVPRDSPHLALNDNLAHQNGNIPKSAILALASCLESLLTAESVDDRFKKRIHGMVMHTLRELSQGTIGEQHRAGRCRVILIKAIIQGGGDLHTPPEGYSETLKRLWRETDHVVRDDISGYARRLFPAASEPRDSAN